MKIISALALAIVILVSVETSFAYSWENSQYSYDYVECTQQTDRLTNQQPDIIYLQVFSSCMQKRGYDVSRDLMIAGSGDYYETYTN